MGNLVFLFKGVHCGGYRMYKSSEERSSSSLHYSARGLCFEGGRRRFMCVYHSLRITVDVDDDR